MIVSSPVSLGICIKQIKLVLQQNSRTQVLLFLESSSPEAQTCSYSHCLPKIPQHSIYFTEFMFFLTAQDKNAFRNDICMSDTAFPPWPQHMASILVNSSVQTLLRQENHVPPPGLLTEFFITSVQCRYTR